MAKKRYPSRKQAAKPLVRRLKADARTTPISLQTDFDVVLSLIAAARARAFVAVNTALIDHYWQIGEHIGQRIAADRWGKRTVEALAEYIQTRQPNARGFSARNLWRMMQFYETYRAAPKLSPLVRELSWTHNLLILSRCKREQEREFYLRVCHRESWESGSWSANWPELCSSEQSCRRQNCHRR
jgi:predicted nuclease of restriction endonuclease-like (RecB) superfamily